MYISTIYTCCIRIVACNWMSCATCLKQLHKFVVAHDIQICNCMCHMQLNFSCKRQLQNPKFLIVSLALQLLFNPLSWAYVHNLKAIEWAKTHVLSLSILDLYLQVVDHIEVLISSYGQPIHYHWNKSHQEWFGFKRNNTSIFVSTLDIKSIRALHLCMIGPNCHWNKKLKLPWSALGRSKWCTCYKASPNFILWHLGFVVIILNFKYILPRISYVDLVSMQFSWSTTYMVILYCKLNPFF
jgi:hypothetical protein